MVVLSMQVIEMFGLFTLVFGICLLLAFDLALSDNPKKELIRLIIYSIPLVTIFALIYIAIVYSKMMLLVVMFQIFSLLGIVYILIIWRDFVNTVIGDDYGVNPPRNK